MVVYMDSTIKLLLTTEKRATEVMIKNNIVKQVEGLEPYLIIEEEENA